MAAVPLPAELERRAAALERRAAAGAKRAG
jgi:hypothetical protein